MYRQKHEQLVQKAREVDAEAHSLRREATAREKEIDQLRSLSVAGDATVQDCVAQLKVAACSLLLFRWPRLTLQRALSQGPQPIDQQIAYMLSVGDFLPPAKQSCKAPAFA